MSIPLAAFFFALFALNRAEEDARLTDLAITRTHEIRAALLQTEVLAFDPDAPLVAVERSLDRFAALAGGDAGDREAVSRIRAAVEQARHAMASGAPTPDVQSARRQARSALNGFNEALESRVLGAAAAHDAARQSLFRLMATCGMVGTLGALFLHLLISGRLARRLRAVEENARRLAHGLPLQISPGGTDEIGDLARQIEEGAERLRARENELLASESRYRGLFQRAPAPYDETDRDGVVRDFNQEVCKLLDASPDRVIGSRAWDFVAPEHRDTFRQAMLERIARGEETPPFEADFVLDGGSRLTVEIRESLLRNAAGEVTGVCRSLLDVTERKLASAAARKVAQYAMELRDKNEQLAHALETARSATEAKSRFLATVSHELRTPLNGIIGFSELLYDGKIGALPEPHREILADILTSARHLLRVISDILDLSKIEAGRMEFRPEPGPLAPLVHEVRDVIRPLADAKKIRIEIDAADEFHAVLDRSRFKQVLYNYLSNAVKFTPDGGRVTVRLAAAGSCFRLEVEDTGIGIPPEEVVKLFKDFQQLSNVRGHEQGTGLGLALTRNIVEAQGGAVGVRSVPGSGSLFTATLPLDGGAAGRIS
jgi:PAS domain S-box-containing protein